MSKGYFSKQDEAWLFLGFCNYGYSSIAVMPIFTLSWLVQHLTTFCGSSIYTGPSRFYLVVSYWCLLLFRPYGSAEHPISYEDMVFSDSLSMIKSYITYCTPLVPFLALMISNADIRVFCCCMAQIIPRIPSVSFNVAVVLGIIGSPGLLSVIGCRLMVHLKEVGAREARGSVDRIG